MFQRLDIKNFRSQKDVSLSFHANVNGFWGRGNAGKTNILRAIYCLLKPNPYKKINSRFAKGEDASITVTTDNEDEVKLVIGKKKVEYFLKNEDGEKSWETRSIPKEIESILNLHDVNIQKQLEGPFLITSSQGKIARTINQTIGTNKIDEWMKIVKAKIGALKYGEVSLTESIEKTENELKPYKSLEKVDKLFSTLRANDTKIKKLEEKYTDISDTCYKILEIRARLTYHENYLELKDKIELFKKNLEEIKMIEKIIEEVKDLKRNIKTLAQERRKQKKLSKQYSSFLKELKVCPFCFVSTKEVKNEILTSQ